jgi:transposase
MAGAAESLFDPAPFESPDGTDVPQHAADQGGTPRLRTPERQQMVISTRALDHCLADEHVARLLWRYVAGLDLRPLLARIQAVEGGRGRNATDPRILITLWLYATVEGISSARELARRCESDDAFRWIAGGVSLNHHTLSDFRVREEAFLDDLLTRSVAALMHQGLVDLNRVTQDGVRVRASAGSKTFRRHPALTNCLSEARQQIQKLKQEAQDKTGDPAQHQPSRAERSLEERERRLTRALAELERMEANRRKGQKPARCSPTDPEARIMKMACGGFRPAYNVQFATDQGSGVVVGVDVVNVGSDKGQLGPDVRSAGAAVRAGAAGVSGGWRLPERGGHRPDERTGDGRVRAAAGMEEVEPVAGRAGSERHAGDGRGASADGERNGEADLPHARQHVGMGERPVPQSWLAAVCGAWAQEGAVRGVLARPDAQCAADARPGDAATVLNRAGALNPRGPGGPPRAAG